MQLSDRVTGGVLVLLGAASAFAGSRLPAVPGQDVGPAAFPMLIGGGLMVCGLMIALGIGHAFEAPEEDAEGAPRFAGLRALLPPAPLIVLAAALTFGARWRLAVPLAVAAPLLVHLVFYKLLRVPLPAGLLPAPWAAAA